MTAPQRATLPDRTELRETVAVALLDHVPEVEDRIHVGRAWPQAGAGQGAGTVFPALLVQDGPRILTTTADGFATLRCQVRIIARVEDSGDAARDEMLDAIACGIQAAMYRHPMIQRLVLVVEEIVSDRDHDATGQVALGQEVHLVTFRMAGFVT